MNIKKITFIGIQVLLLILLVVGCGQSSPDSNKSTEQTRDTTITTTQDNTVITAVVPSVNTKQAEQKQRSNRVQDSIKLDTDNNHLQQNTDNSSAKQVNTTVTTTPAGISVPPVITSPAGIAVTSVNTTTAGLGIQSTTINTTPAGLGLQTENQSEQNIDAQTLVTYEGNQYTMKGSKLVKISPNGTETTLDTLGDSTTTEDSWENIVVYDGFVYYSDEEVIYKIDIDGTKKEQLDGGFEIYATIIGLHNDWIYVLHGRANITYISRTNINTKSSDKYILDEEVGPQFYCHLAGDYLYYSSGYMSRINLTSDTIDNNYTLKVKNTGDFSIKDDWIYFNDADTSTPGKVRTNGQDETVIGN